MKQKLYFILATSIFATLLLFGCKGPEEDVDKTFKFASAPTGHNLVDGSSTYSGKLTNGVLTIPMGGNANRFFTLKAASIKDSKAKITYKITGTGATIDKSTGQVLLLKAINGANAKVQKVTVTATKEESYTDPVTKKVTKSAYPKASISYTLEVK